MRLGHLPGDVHLTYCTNIHAGESWPEVRDSLESHLPRIKAAVSPGEPLGLGLRLSAIAAQVLSEPSAFEELRALLARHDLYVFTINAFPYGPFHGVHVKEGVYEPDWRDPERLAFTNRVADILDAHRRATVNLRTGELDNRVGIFIAHVAGKHHLDAIQPDDTREFRGARVCRRTLAALVER